MKKIQYLIYYFFIIFFLFTYTLLTEEQPEELSLEKTIEKRKEQIQRYYQSPACFKIIFRTDIKVPGMGVQSAMGSVRADNKKNRIRIILTEPNLGFTLSWITIIQNQAYMSNPRREGVIRIPLKQLELGSLANNNIRFPFSLFQDILFGRLPSKLLKSSDWQEKDNMIIAKYTENNGDTIIFYFGDNQRIQKVSYIKPSAHYIAIAHFIGKFYNTKYPKVLKIQSFQTRPKKKKLESMNIKFYRYIKKAWCKDRYFPTR